MTVVTFAQQDVVTEQTLPGLAGATSVATAVIEGVTYLFAAGYDGNAITVFELGAEGSLTAVSGIADDATLEINGPWSVTTATVGGTTYLFAAGYNDSGVSVFSVGAGGSLTNVENVNDDATLQVGGADSVATAVIGDKTFLFVAGYDDQGLSVFEVGADGSLTNVDNAHDDATLQLDRAYAVTTAEVGGTTYLFASGDSDSGISVFRVDADGHLTNTANVTDNETLQLFGVQSVTTATIGGATYLFAGGYNDGGISVFTVGTDGTLDNVFNLQHDWLEGVSCLTAADIGGTPYLFAGSYWQGFVGALEIGNNGSLEIVGDIFDYGSLHLRGVNSIAVSELDGGTYLSVAAGYDDAVTVLEVETDDTLIGTSGADHLAGHGGNDVLIGGTGNDILDGGTGNDWLDGGAGIDTMIGGAGNDRFVVNTAHDVVNELVGGGFDTVLAKSDYALAAGAEVEVLEVFGSTGRALTGNEFANQLIGGGGNDTLDGRDGNDFLDGRVGADTMTGGAGDDTYVVNDGGDVVTEAAGGGSDTVLAKTSYALAAGSEVEVLRAAAGATGLVLTGNALANTLIGVAGDDTLNGGAGDDRLQGGAGNDRLDGQHGHDLLFGGAGNDTFVFSALSDTGLGTNRDIIKDFAAGDVIDLQGLEADAGVWFNFIEGDAFSHQAGEVRAFAAGGSTIIAGDVNGDARADFQIQLSGLHTLHDTDFLMGLA